MNPGTNLRNNPPYNMPEYGPRTIEIHPEDIKLSKECIQEGFLKVGLPFAIGIHLLTNRTIPSVKNTPFAVKMFFFPITAFVGCYFFYGPVCNKRLRAQIAARQQLQGQSNMSLPDQDSSLRSGESDATSFDTVTGTNSVESDSYFSPLNLDYESFKPQDFDNLQGEKKMRETTYEELRQKNRDNYQKQLYQSYQTRGNTADTRKGNESSFLEDSTTSQFKPSGFKNKYGDDME